MSSIENSAAEQPAFSEPRAMFVMSGDLKFRYRTSKSR